MGLATAIFNATERLELPMTPDRIKRYIKPEDEAFIKNSCHSGQVPLQDKSLYRSNTNSPKYLYSNSTDTTSWPV
jgi:hypothetical protein